MISLIKANFYRLKKDATFWILIVVSLFLALFSLYRYKELSRFCYT